VGNGQGSGENPMEFLYKNRTFRVLKLGDPCNYLHLGVFLMLKVKGYIKISHTGYLSREGKCGLEGVT
jgi:hypothetical protein